jgi:streptogramin lyase
VLWVVEAAKPNRFGQASGTPAALERLDPLSGIRRATTALRPVAHQPCCPDPTGLLAVTSGAVWVVGTAGWVYRLDLRTGRLLTLRTLAAQGIASGDGQVWILDQRGGAVRLDPRTGRAVARVAVPSRLNAIAVGAGAVWLTDRLAGTVWKVGPGPVRDVRTIGVEPGVDSLAVGAGPVWIANSAAGTVARIDPASSRMTARIAVANTPRAVSVGGGRVWVTVAGAGRGAVPAAGGLRAGARVKPLSAPPVRAGADGSRRRPDVLIASDLPLQGTTMRSITLPMVDALAFLLREHRFRAGRFRIGYQACDDAIAQTGVADDAKRQANARAYAGNPGAAAGWSAGCWRA